MKKPERLAIEYKTASYRRKSEILKQLWKINRGYIYKLMCKVSGCDRDDLEALLKARFLMVLEKYNPDKGRFLTFLSWQLKGERQIFFTKNHTVGRSETVWSLNEKVRIGHREQPIEKIDLLESEYKADYEHGPIETVRRFLDDDEVKTLRIYLEALSMCKTRSYGHLKYASRIAGITGEGFRQKFNRVISKVRMKIEHRRVKYVGNNFCQ